MPPQPDSDDDAAAFADFTKSLPVETAADRRERREAGTRRVAAAIFSALWCAPCAGLGATIAVVWEGPQPLLTTGILALAAIVGAFIGAVMWPLMTLLSFLRATDGGPAGMLSSKIPNERVDPVPFFRWSAPLGAAIGAWLCILFAAKRLVNGQVGEFTPLLGGAVGAVFYLVIRLTQWLFFRNQPPASEDCAD